MKTQRFSDGSDVRQILSAMVQDPVVCSRIASHWDDRSGLFQSRWANLIGWWCVKHLKKYGQPPNENIQVIFERWVETSTADEETIQAVERFLVDLSETDVKGNQDYILDLAENHFCKVVAEREYEEAGADLSQGLHREAIDRMRNLPSLSLKPDPYFEPVDDPGIWVDALENIRTRPLIDYPGDLGDFFGDMFSRRRLVSFMAPNKTGKTVWLVDAAYRAVRKRNRVLFVNLGDGTELDVIERLAKRATMAGDFEGKCRNPVKIDEEYRVTHEAVKMGKVDPVDAYRSFRRACRAGTDAFRLMAYANSSATVADIDALLARFSRESWKPDVVIVDYADILAHPAGVHDKNDVHEENWKQLTRLHHDWNCLVLTATQSNAISYSRSDTLLGRQHFTGRRTKLDQVDGMIGINVTEQERQKQMCRLNWVVRRRARDRHRKECVHVAGCYEIENPAVLSKW